ncbi:MAG: hypothetical protein EVA89_07420 [Sandaracinaceae bacterium]|nr:MAG: hypothetical protein EVA89_07420 [Sandaracinaceae bacterium]
MRSFFLLALSSMFSLGCSSVHGVEDAAVPDAALADGAVPDADPVLAPPDAGSIRCAFGSAERFGGEPCFCYGDAALGSGYLYRQTVGVEIWDVRDPSAPVLAGNIEGDTGTQGGVAVIGDRLISATSFPPGVRLYGLADPASPTLLHELSLGERRVSDAAVAGARVAVALEEAGVVEVAALDLEADVLTERWRASVGDSIVGLFADADRVFVFAGRFPPHELWLVTLDAGSGEVLAEQRVHDSAAPLVDAWLEAGRLLAVFDHTLLELDVVGAPEERRRIELPFYASAITRRGAQLAIGGSELALLDPDSLEVTHRLDQGTGDRASLFFLEDALVYSNQGGVASVALVCAP